MWVPWKNIASWHCNACGKCCRVYKPRLTAYEYLKLLGTGMVEEKLWKFYIPKIRGKCPFQYGNLCLLQNKMKPISCKSYPFIVYKKGNEEALFELNRKKFYVYADAFCPNLRIKYDLKPRPEVYQLAKEAVELSLGRQTLRLITAKKSKIPLNLSFGMQP